MDAIRRGLGAATAASASEGLGSPANSSSAGRRSRENLLRRAGLISVILQAGATRIEVGVIGPEAFVDASNVIPGSTPSPYGHVGQVAGIARVIDRHVLEAAMERSPTLRRQMLRVVQAALFQARQTAFVNVSFGIETRLARWRLQCHDRVAGDELLLTHEILAVMLWGFSVPA